MKQLLFIMAFVSAMALGGCSDKKEVANNVRFTIEANTGQPVRIYSPTDKGETGTVICKSYESSFKTGPTVFGIEARCDDETTLITIRVWVNGKLKCDVSGNKYLTTGEIRLL